VKRSNEYFNRNKFRELRLAKSLNQYELAERLGTLQSEISRIETGVVGYPSLCVIVKATRLFNCELSDLIIIDYSIPTHDNS